MTITGVQQCLDILPQIRISVTCLLQETHPLGRFALHGRIEDLLDSPPSFRSHSAFTSKKGNYILDSNRMNEHRDTKTQRHKENSANNRFDAAFSLCLCVCSIPFEFEPSISLPSLEAKAHPCIRFSVGSGSLA